MSIMIPPDRSKMVPKPPTNSRPKESNLSSRNRQFSRSNRDIVNQREASDLSSTGDLEQDSLIEIINSTPRSTPLSARLNKYQALPQIGTKLSNSNKNNNKQTNVENNENDDHKKIVIGLRFPDGKKRESQFDVNSKIDVILDYAINEMKKANPTVRKSQFTLLQMPNIVITDLNKQICSYDITNRSMLFVIKK